MALVKGDKIPTYIYICFKSLLLINLKNHTIFKNQLIYIHIYIYIYTHTYVCVCVSMRACVCVCVCARTPVSLVVE